VLAFHTSITTFFSSPFSLLYVCVSLRIHICVCVKALERRPPSRKKTKQNTHKHRHTKTVKTAHKPTHNTHKHSHTNNNTPKTHPYKRAQNTYILTHPKRIIHTKHTETHTHTNTHTKHTYIHTNTQTYDAHNTNAYIQIEGLHSFPCRFSASIFGHFAFAVRLPDCNLHIGILRACYVCGCVRVCDVYVCMLCIGVCAYVCNGVSVKNTKRRSDQIRDGKRERERVSEKERERESIFIYRSSERLKYPCLGTLHTYTCTHTHTDR